MGELGSGVVKGGLMFSQRADGVVFEFFGMGMMEVGNTAAVQ